jgi:hypothetical protein
MHVWFSVQLSSEIFLIARRIQWDIIILVYRFSCKVQIILVRFESNFNFIECAGSSVGIATAYRHDGSGIESRWGARFFAPVQTSPEAHPASCTMGTGSFPGVRFGRGVTLTPHPLLVPRSKIEQSYNSTLPKGLCGLWKGETYLILSTDFRKILQYPISWKSANPSREIRIVPCGRTDSHNEADSRF